MIKKLSYFLVILSVLIFGAGDTYAQNVMKVDFVKTSQKFSIWVQKQAENFENAMKEIAESQFGTFIGKGIDAAKQAFKFVKEQLQRVKELYKTAKKTTEDVKASDAYKIAMLSKQLATETMVLDTLKKQRDSAKASVKSDAELKMVTLDEKITLAKENLDVGVSIFEGEIAELKSEEEIDVKKKELETFRNDNVSAISAIEEERSNIEKASKDEIKQIDINFAISIAEQSAVIAGLGIEIAELTKKKKQKDGEMEKDPEKVIESTIDDFSYKEGEVPTLEDRKNKDKKRQRRLETISSETSGMSLDIVGETEDKIEEESQNSATSETVSGKSEALQTAISQTAAQLEGAYNYLLLELRAIEFETANLMVDNKEYVAGKAESSINICNYQTDKRNIFDKLKDAKSKVEGAVGKVQETVNKVQEKVNQAVEIVGDVTAAGVAVVGTAKAIKSAIKDKDVDAITGLTGM